jgi:hypothetical protein
MNRIFFYLFCILSFASIHAFECDDYDLTWIEEENIGDYEEEIIDEPEFIGFKVEEDDEELDDDENFSSSKSLFKNFSAKNNAKEMDSNSAMATLEAGPSAVVAGCVNAITGTFFESCAPLSIPGAIPLTVQCTYCSSEKKWHFQHMPSLKVGHSRGENHLRASYCDDNGSGMVFRDYLDDTYPNDIKHNELTVSSSLFEKGLTNCGCGEISGKTNWRNSRFKIAHRARNEKKSYIYEHSSNIKRVFSRYKSYGHKIEAPTGNNFYK